MLSKIARVFQPIRQTNKVVKTFCAGKTPNSEKQEQQQQQEQQQEQQQQNQEQQQEQGEQKRQGRTSKPEQENERIVNKKEKINYGWQSWRVFVWGNIGLVGYNLYLECYSENSEEQTGSIYPYNKTAKYLKQQYQDTIDFFTKPPVKQLLQEIPFLPPGMEPPKTIILNLSGTLIHSNYVFGKGTEIMKRPGLQKFLRTLAQQYEVVVFSDDETMFTFELVDKLDTTRSIFSGRFGRESMVYESGDYIKDLKYLGRDLSRVICVELNPDKVKYHQENAIFLPKFEGNTEDNELLKLLPFLQHLGQPQVKDVRQEIALYGNHNPSEKFLQELQQKHQQMKRKQNSGIQGLFGGSGQQRTNYGQQNFGRF